MKELFKKILAWPKEYYLYIVFIALFFILLPIVDKCSHEEIDNTIVQVDVNKLRRHLIDSIATENHKKYILFQDSLEAVRQTQIKAKDKTIASLEKDNLKMRKKLEEIYQENDIVDLEACAEIVEVQKDIIENRDSVVIEQKKEIDIQKESLVFLNEKYNKQVEETTRVRSLQNQCESDVILLQKQLEKQNTWWKRNEKWLYLGAGVLGTLIVLK